MVRYGAEEIINRNSGTIIVCVFLRTKAIIDYSISKSPLAKNEPSVEDTGEHALISLNSAFAKA